jgi:hypothetical protein
MSAGRRFTLTLVQERPTPLTDATDAATRLADAAVRAGGLDDLTAAALPGDPAAPGSSPGGGPVADHPLSATEREQVAAALRADADRLTPLAEFPPRCAAPRRGCAC